MKVAIQMFGHMRTYLQCCETLRKNLLEIYDCDVFVHTWDEIEHKTQTWHNDKMSDIQKITEKDVEDAYLCKAVKVEHQYVQEKGYIEANGLKISKFGIESMLYSMNEVNSLRKEYQQRNNIHYDFIVFIRPDIFLYDKLDLNKYANELKNGFFTAGNYKNDAILNDFRNIGASDILFFAQPTVMDKIFENFNLVKSQILEKETSLYGPEYSFVYAIQQIGINVYLLNYLHGINWKICRKSTPEKIIKKKPEKIKLIKNFIKSYFLFPWYIYKTYKIVKGGK